MREMKDSGIEWIGEIPADWTTTRIGIFFHFSSGDSLTNEEIQDEGLYKVYGANGPRGYYHHTNLTGKHILIGRVGALCGNIHIVNEPIWVTEHALIAEQISPGVYTDFAARVFESMNLGQYSKASAQPVIASSVVQRLQIPIPPSLEQRHIAKYLDRKCGQIDAIIARQQEVIEKLKAYKLSVITKAVTKGLNPNVPMKDSGVEWIGEIPEHWSIHKFCWDYSAMLGKMLDVKRITGEHLHPYIKNADVQWDSINFENLDEMDFSDEEKERYTICPGDLMVCEGGEIGKCAIVPDDISKGIYDQKALHRVRKRCPDSGNIHFLCKVIYCMARNNCLNTSPEKATIAHLPGDALNQLRIPTPPILEQKQIAEHLNSKCMEIDSLSTRKQEVIDKLIEYKKSLIYEVVTGKKEV